jgi:CRP-like cAMP-binding protein
MLDQTQSIHGLFASSPLFVDLDAAGWKRLLEIGAVRSFAPGERIFEEGSVDPNLYVIKRGFARVVKSTSTGEAVHQVAEIGPGEPIGEMKLFAPQPATASVYAIGAVDVMVIDLDRLRAEPDRGGLRAALAVNIARILADRLRGSSTKVADALQADLDEIKLRDSAGRFFVYLFAIMSGFAFFVALLAALGDRRPSQMTQSLLVILGCTAPVLYLLLRSPYPRATYGLTTAGWPRAVRDGIVLSLPLLLLLTLLKLAWLHLAPAPPGASLFDLDATLDGPFSLGPWLLGAAVYAVVCPVQELFARAGLQASLHHFLGRDDRRTRVTVIVISNLIFASAHTYLGVRFMLAAFVPGLFWGWLFHRQRSLVGVSVSHILVGLWALFVLGLQVVIGGK